jgi:hypothetical protein
MRTATVSLPAVIKSGIVSFFLEPMLNPPLAANTLAFRVFHKQFDLILP